ncbi:pseudouridine synthase [Shewanella schlegeliana]|uniref:Pseudouridine synthase n=1 Tax=Shewanella schlegeliana TaxID=190308 RepID=A0ABS1T243_9GAMM|nr:pseudouridine synthase [Shewanella schlegeliana]MBL4914285.1 pseudouridine synthase [Shewanella schlegeliana]MCL1109492.1 pseudouridine synthase [Shewanella schlegeliana]GIU33575.1 pseudouridine synthase [Shewanella schlegeliana]
MRLDKFICKSTELNRSQASECIERAEVSVNGEVITDVRFQVHESNEVRYRRQRLVARPSRYIMLHKPLHTLSSNVDGDYPSLFRCIDIERVEDLHIVGRLDADTTGLVLLTDDGRWSFDIIRPDKQCEKTYRVTLRDPIIDDAVEMVARFAHGLQLQNEQALTLPAKLELVTEKEVLLTITEGKYHQVKRMFAAVGNRVNGLHREKIGDLSLDLKVGEWRYLSEGEVHQLSTPTPQSKA